MFTYVQSLEPLTQENENNGYSKFVQQLFNVPSFVRRTVHGANRPKVSKEKRDDLIQSMMPKSRNKILRNSVMEAEKIALEHRATLVEAELKNSLTGKLSALMDRPYVEQSGKNDYLVMRPDIVDPFVTVIPNAMYYNIEKKCVNWLDDCSLKGIRARLLRGVQSPYKK